MRTEWNRQELRARFRWTLRLRRGTPPSGACSRTKCQRSDGTGVAVACLASATLARAAVGRNRPRWLRAATWPARAPAPSWSGV